MAKSAAVNIFAKAKANPTASAGSKKPEPPKVQTENLSPYAILDALEKQCKAMKETLREPLDEQIYKTFLSKRDNYKGIDGKASASMQVQKRSSTSGLEDVEITLCEKKGISLARIEGDFKLNVAGVSEKKLQEVSDAIAKIKDLPADFIQFDASKARTITTATSIEECFRLNDPEDIIEMLKVVSVTNIKPKTSAQLDEILKEAAKLLK